MSFKKAGIVLGITFILLAFGVYWLATHLGNKGAEGSSSSAPLSNLSSLSTGNTVATGQSSSLPQSDSSTSNQVATSSAISPSVGSTTSSTSSNTASPTSSTTTIATTTDNAPTHIFYSLAASNLGTPISSSTEIMVLSKKKLVVLDNAYGTDNGKQLFYAVDLLYSGGTLTYFVSGSDFNTLTVGEQVKVTYDVYQNNLGVSFPVVMHIQ